jgi:hypothetical protein
MKVSYKKTAIAVGAAIASLGALRMSSAASSVTLIEDDQSAVVDGWNITAPTGVSLTVTSSDNEIFVEKAANFTVPNQGFQIAFQPVAGATGASSIDFTDETVQNNTGQAFSGFDFILMNIGSPNATFDGVANVFAAPSGTGYSYSGTINLNSTKDILSYTGNQNAGTTSDWGSATPGDNLLIDTPAGSDFSLKELSMSGGGGGGGGGSAVPMPAAAWQSLASLAALGLIGIGRSIKRRLA